MRRVVNVCKRHSQHSAHCIHTLYIEPLRCKSPYSGILIVQCNDVTAIGSNVMTSLHSEPMRSTCSVQTSSSTVHGYLTMTSYGLTDVSFQ